MEATAREAMHYDVVIVGAGPAGLSAAIRLKQRAAAAGRELGVCVLEKGSEVGAHILSGAVMDPRALDELFPDWRQRKAPLDTPVSADRFLLLNERKAWQLPGWMLPSCFQNHGNYVISLGTLVRWLGQQAEALGVEIFAGFAATEILRGARGEVAG
jgi:electron-transferring-flavoprotein dehydrogenase